MKEKQLHSYLPLVESNAGPGSAKAAHVRSPASLARAALTAALALLALSQLYAQLPTLGSSKSVVHWKACGTGLQCATVSAPLDWRNLSDPRTVSIAVVKKAADPTKERLGSIFINPGGPGGSGTGFAHAIGTPLSVLSGGQFDIIGFDPRGVNATRPYVSCFDSALSEYLYLRSAPLSLDIPVNFSTAAPGSTSPGDPQAVVDYLTAQVRLTEATVGAMYEQCSARSGDSLSFMGTEFVVRDLELMAKLFDGPEAKVNLWGFSYGTVLGQYVTAILPPERVGKIVIDGVVDGKTWKAHGSHSISIENIEEVFQAFADECVEAGDACSLSHLGNGAAILSAIDGVIDKLYAQPAPALSPPNVPGLLARSYHARGAGFLAAYAIASWPSLAEQFAAALKGDYSKIAADAPLSESYESAAKRHDSGMWAVLAIRCADQAPYTARDPPPTTDEVALEIVESLATYSRRAGEGLTSLSWCKVWKEPKRSFYDGTFEWEEGELDTPVLVLSQKLDPVTPLSSAKIVQERYGKSNARLVEQNGTGHCTISQASLATAKILQAYWASGAVPEATHSFTTVDQVAFPSAEQLQQLDALAVEDRELLAAWAAVGEEVLRAQV